MKKIFLIVLLTTGVVVSANNTLPNENVKNSPSISDVQVQNFDDEDCTVIMDIKITGSDGKTTTIKGSVTTKGTSCGDLIKQIVK